MKIIVAVRDRAVDAFGQPFFVQARGEAIRSFQDVVNNPAPDNNIARHPEDFDLYQLGEYDENEGEIKPCKPQMLAVGKDMVRGREEK